MYEIIRLGDKNFNIKVLVFNIEAFACSEIIENYIFDNILASVCQN